jgi:phosphate transport system protein
MSQNTLLLQASRDAMTGLDADIKRMGELALENLRLASEGLLQRNTDLCNQAIADDDEVDRLEKKVDRVGVEIITRFGPVASNYRRIIASMKVSTALERVSDHAVSLARRGRKLNDRPPIPETAGIRELTTLAAAQLTDSIAAYCDSQLDAALRIQARDTALDQAYEAFTQRIIARMETDSAHVKDYVDLLFATRFIERIGDQSVNIAEDTVYHITAMDIRHGGALPQGGSS